MKGELIKLLESIFLEEEVTDEMIQQKLRFSNSVISTLFDFVNQELLYVTESEEKRKILKNTCDYLYRKFSKDIEKGIAIPIKNLKSLLFKLKKLPIDELYEETKDISKHIEELLDKNTYVLLEYIIYHMRDLNKLSAVLKKHESMVNLKDKNNTSLYFRIIQDYIREITSLEFDEKNILYFNGVLLIIKNKSLQVTKKEKNSYLQKVNDEIIKLDKNEEYYLERKKLLKNLYQLIWSRREIEVDRFSLLDKYNISILFNERIMGEMYKYTSRESKNRRVFIDEYTITIDKKSTKEIDDALTIKKLSNGNYLLGVHIANVLGYLPYDSEIVDNAIRSGKTLYLTNPEKNYSATDILPIFPLEFSAGSASLIQNERRLANSHFIEFDSEANIVDFYSMKTVIRNNAQCSYSYINKVLKQGGKSKKLMETVFLLDELTYKLQEKKYSDLGCTRAEAIVEIATRLVNSEIANFFYTNGFPFLYRVHELDSEMEQDIKVLKQIKSDVASLKLYQKFRNTYNARFDTKGFHEKLNKIPYCHGTSPLRRGEDIVVEHCLDTCYFKSPMNEELYLLEEDMERKKDIVNLAYSRIEMFLKEDRLVNKNKSQKVKNLKK